MDSTLGTARRARVLARRRGSARGADAGDTELEHRLGFGFGWCLEGAREVAYEVRFEGSRHEPAKDDNAPEHHLGVRLTARW